MKILADEIYKKNSHIGIDCGNKGLEHDPLFCKLKNLRTRQKKLHLKIFLIFAIFFFAFIPSIGQVPHITGTVRLSIDRGIIDAELKLSNLPKVENYSIWLNTGLNIEYFRDGEDKFNLNYTGEYKPEKSGEAFQYYFLQRDNQRQLLPTSFIVKYTGKFPVIKDTLRASEWGDWKGNMAFNGKSFRASEQSAWYPILYDKTNDIVLDKYTYNIEVVCSDCRSLYLNGNLPVSQTQATFTSETAVSLLIFVGDYDFAKYDNIYILNSQLNKEKQKTLSMLTNQIIDFYEDNLQIPYGMPVTYLSTTPVSKRNEWMFVTYPTIAVVGIDKYKLESYFDDVSYQLKDKSNIAYIAHELAHYYIGTFFVPNSTLSWFFLEGLTEYLSIQVVRNILDESFYQDIIASYEEKVSDFEAKPLNKINSANEINEIYRYNYVPLFLTAIEKQIGVNNMWGWIRIILKSGNRKTDFDFFISTLDEAGITDDDINFIIDEYIDHPKAKENVMNSLK